MKNRNLFCYALDFLGLVGLASAAIALTAAIWFQASALEGTLLLSFKYCLAASISAFLVARISEISTVLRTAPTPAPVGVHADNVEQLPERGSLPRAA